MAFACFISWGSCRAARRGVTTRIDRVLNRRVSPACRAGCATTAPGARRNRALVCGANAPSFLLCDMDMTTTSRSVKRQLVWDHMLQLEQDGLGWREVVSQQRDKFVLNQQHGAATALSTRIDANGFIRADTNSLLFRDASDTLRAWLEALKPGAASRSDKGYEVRWSVVEASDIARMFEAVRSNAAKVAPTPTTHVQQYSTLAIGSSGQTLI